ncbi:MAG: repeat protein [Candidatus Solibacter sp.]|nr:repeat protein [Candidatus Solibacter sp.]
MLAGQFENAWRESDRIAARGTPDPHRFWDGCPFTGKRVMIRCLHGFGDAIQFARYAPMVRRDAARVMVQTHGELINVMGGISGVDDVITWSDEGSAPWDQQIELMELPRAFRTTLDTIPNVVPYLHLTPEQKVRSRIEDPPNGKVRIGLQWGSGAWNPERSISLADLRPLLHVPEFEYFSFQRGEPRAELANFESPYPIHDVSGESPDLIEAAADLLNIDLLITVDTMLAHLAGALAIPVWVLLPWEADWRWMLHRRDSPWYPTMTLFRQPAPGEWHSAVLEAAAALPTVLSR